MNNYDELDLDIDNINNLLSIYKNTPEKLDWLQLGLASKYDAIFNDDFSGEYFIIERQTIEKLIILTDQKLVHDSITSKNYDVLANKLMQYNIDFEKIRKNLDNINDKNNKNNLLACEIDKILILGFNEKLYIDYFNDVPHNEINDNINDFEDYLFTENVSDKPNRIKYEGLDNTIELFSKIKDYYSKNLVLNKKENSYGNN